MFSQIFLLTLNCCYSQRIRGISKYLLNRFCLFRSNMLVVSVLTEVTSNISTDISNYSGICKPTTIGKLFESIVTDNSYDHANYISCDHHGLVKGSVRHSIIILILYLHYLKKSFFKSQSDVICFFT